MALPIAPPLPLTTGSSLNPAAEEERQNKEKDTTATAAAAAAMGKGEDDDVQLDRDVLELMGGWVSG